MHSTKVSSQLLNDASLNAVLSIGESPRNKDVDNEFCPNKTRMLNGALVNMRAESAPPTLATQRTPTTSRERTSPSSSSSSMRGMLGKPHKRRRIRATSAETASELTLLTPSDSLRFDAISVSNSISVSVNDVVSNSNYVGASESGTTTRSSSISPASGSRRGHEDTDRYDEYPREEEEDVRSFQKRVDNRNHKRNLSQSSSANGGDCSFRVNQLNPNYMAGHPDSCNEADDKASLYSYVSCSITESPACRSPLHHLHESFESSSAHAGIADEEYIPATPPPYGFTASYSLGCFLSSAIDAEVELEFCDMRASVRVDGSSMAVTVSEGEPEYEMMEEAPVNQLAERLFPDLAASSLTGSLNGEYLGESLTESEGVRDLQGDFEMESSLNDSQESGRAVGPMDDTGTERPLFDDESDFRVMVDDANGSTLEACRFDETVTDDVTEEQGYTMSDGSVSGRELLDLATDGSFCGDPFFLGDAFITELAAGDEEETREGSIAESVTDGHQVDAASSVNGSMTGGHQDPEQDFFRDVSMPGSSVDCADWTIEESDRHSDLSSPLSQGDAYDRCEHTMFLTSESRMPPGESGGGIMFAGRNLVHGGGTMPATTPSSVLDSEASSATGKQEESSRRSMRCESTREAFLANEVARLTRSCFDMQKRLDMLGDENAGLKAALAFPAEGTGMSPARFLKAEAEGLTRELAESVGSIRGGIQKGFDEVVKGIGSLRRVEARLEALGKFFAA
ncbi:hypothetical protein BC830DRAFT_1081040 [Chytriomyces sp. MP71]|nr:hypothetical protein BC830DRAFT_1081040 [Chytriomyces sp. MP71]